MGRRKFLSNTSAAVAASIAGATALSAKADALKEARSGELDKRIATPWMCSIDPTREPIPRDNRPWYQHYVTDFLCRGIRNRIAARLL